MRSVCGPCGPHLLDADDVLRGHSKHLPALQGYALHTHHCSTGGIFCPQRAVSIVLLHMATHLEAAWCSKREPTQCRPTPDQAHTSSPCPPSKQESVSCIQNILMSTFSSSMCSHMMKRREAAWCSTRGRSTMPLGARSGCPASPPATSARPACPPQSVPTTD